MKKIQQPTLESFKNDVSTHVMTIELDDGVHRCLHFGRDDGSSFYHFRIITWPGGLTFTGDMETYTFSRMRDMFQFFRDPDGLDGKHPINTGYWGEKVQGPVQISEFCPEHAVSNLREWIEQQAEEEDHEEIDAETKSSFMEVYLEENSIESMDDVARFAHEFEHHDWWDWAWEVKTFNFVWCCYAIVWAIHTYDQHKKS